MNVAELVSARAERDPAQPALIHASGVWTYGRLVSCADAFAARVRGLTVGSCPRVALCGPNGPEYVALALGMLWAGACFVPVPSELAVEERIALLRLTSPQLVVAAGKKPWLPLPGTAERVAGIEFQWARFDGRPGFPEDRFQALQPAFVRFSSGTTGTCKGVVIGHQTLLDRVRSANRRLRLTAADRVLWTLPMAHHFAVSIMLYLLEGAATVLEDSHLAADILTTARATCATVFYGSPFHLALLAAEDSGRDWPSLRLAIGTAAALPAQTAAEFTRRYGRAPAQGFGIIEAGLPLLNTADPEHRPESVGVPDDVEVSLRDEAGQEVPAGTLGELWLRGPGMFDAYLSPWTERAKATQEGWFATADLAWRDAEGFIFVRGRRDSAINFGGLKVFPEEVEEVLNTHPDVSESRVSGAPHERWGAVAVAEIVPCDRANPPAAPVLARYCRERLAAYKVPVRFRVVGAIPRTASGKVRR